MPQSRQQFDTLEIDLIAQKDSFIDTVKKTLKGLVDNTEIVQSYWKDTHTIKIIIGEIIYEVTKYATYSVSITICFSNSQNYWFCSENIYSYYELRKYIYHSVATIKNKILQKTNNFTPYEQLIINDTDKILKFFGK